MEWEEDADNVYTIRDTRTLRCVGYAAASAVAVGLGMLDSLQARMPIHRGDLTPAQYAQNVNDAIAFRVADMIGEYGRTLLLACCAFKQSGEIVSVENIIA